MSAVLRLLLLFTLPIILLACGGWYWMKLSERSESTDNAYLKTHLIPLSARLTSRVTELRMDENRPVRRGEELLFLDDREFRSRVAQAEALLETEEAHIQMLQAQLRQQQANIRIEQAQLASAEADRDRSSRDLARYEALTRNRVITEQAHDAARAGYARAMAEVDRARASHDAASKQMATIGAQIAESQARLKAAEAALELARFDLENTCLRAPADGIIARLAVQPGQLVRPGAVLAYLIPRQNVWVEANFKESQLEQIKPGQTASIRLDAYPARSFHGVVDSLSPTTGSELSILPPENATGNFTKIVRRVPVKILLQANAEDSHLLRPGLSAMVKVKLE